MPLIFTQLAADSFHRADENPLDPAKWSLDTAGNSPLQVVSDKCIASAVTGCDDFYTDADWPGNQWAEVELTDLAPDTTAVLLLRSAPDFSWYNNLFIVGGAAGFGNDCLVGYLASTNSGDTILYQNNAGKVSAGDVFRVAVIENRWWLFQNGKLLATGFDTNPADDFYGKVALGAVPNTAITDVGFKNFQGGSVVNVGVERQNFNIDLFDEEDGTYLVSTYDMSGGPGVADQGLEIEGYRIQLHDNGDGTYAITTTTSTGVNDVEINIQGFKLKLHPTGQNDPVLGKPMYAFVVNPV